MWNCTNLLKSVPRWCITALSVVCSVIGSLFYSYITFVSKQAQPPTNVSVPAKTLSYTGASDKLHQTRTSDAWWWILVSLCMQHMLSCCRGWDVKLFHASCRVVGKCWSLKIAPVCFAFVLPVSWHRFLATIVLFGWAFYFFKTIFRLHRMHEMQAIVTDDRGVCLSVCP